MADNHNTSGIGRVTSLPVAVDTSIPAQPILQQLMEQIQLLT